VLIKRDVFCSSPRAEQVLFLFKAFPQRFPNNPSTIPLSIIVALGRLFYPENFSHGRPHVVESRSAILFPSGGEKGVHKYTSVARWQSTAALPLPPRSLRPAAHSGFFVAVARSEGERRKEKKRETDSGVRRFPIALFPPRGSAARVLYIRADGTRIYGNLGYILDKSVSRDERRTGVHAGRWLRLPNIRRI